MSCLMCHGKARYHEQGAPERVFCGQACQKTMHEQVGLFDPVNLAPRDIRRLQLLYLDPISLANMARTSPDALEITKDDGFMMDYIERHGYVSVVDAVIEAIRINANVVVMAWWDYVKNDVMGLSRPFIIAAVENNNNIVLRKIRRLIDGEIVLKTIRDAAKSIVRTPNSNPDWNKLVLYQNALYPWSLTLTGEIIALIASRTEQDDIERYVDALIRLATRETLLLVFGRESSETRVNDLLELLTRRLHETNPELLRSISDAMQGMTGSDTLNRNMLFLIK